MSLADEIEHASLPIGIFSCWRGWADTDIGYCLQIRIRPPHRTSIVVTWYQHEMALGCPRWRFVVSSGVSVCVAKVDARAEGSGPDPVPRSGLEVT